ncbi:unnamed protein product [Victoria cruziana]
MALVSRLILRGAARSALSIGQREKLGIRWLSNSVEKTGENIASSFSPSNDDIAVSDKEEKSKEPSRRGGGRWGRSRAGRDTAGLVPFGFGDFFAPMGVGTRLQQALENLNRMLGSFSPARFDDDLMADMSPDYWLTEDDGSYRVRFDMPGLSKEDVRVTVREGFLMVRGEHKESREDSGREGRGRVWLRSYGYYSSSFLLPENVKPEEIKAEMKHGVLEVVIPKAEGEARNVKEIAIM